MAAIQQLYHDFRFKALQDPILMGLLHGTITWNDALSMAEENNENNKTYMSAVNSEINRIKLHASTPILPPCTENLYNHNQVKTLVVRNLPRDIDVNELHEIFGKHGVLCDIYIPKNQDQNSPYYGTIRGFALVKFLTSQESTRAYMAETLNLVIRGKKIAVEFAKEDH